MSHVEILFNRIQSQQINSVFTENCVKTFEFHIQKIQNIDYSTEAVEPKPERQRQETRCGRKHAMSFKCSAKNAFRYARHLIAASLVKQNKYSTLKA